MNFFVKLNTQEETKQRKNKEKTKQNKNKEIVTEPARNFHFWVNYLFKLELNRFTELII